ncbi:hypothetical protein AB1Y20_001620 [Prymnesium parvum]|uniref:Uncharacterized protein n=1 Tax=Prymnesium parvum TaxID=97485 RepID=A0AB34K8U2_PRYPA|mmetsp:Transcript_47075/g.116543  ORF Transcript_47075/g.116543 Transcript_47075/m.116543 type:complete len:212 (-) Transcript_47075:408-1043(-)
MRSPTPTGAEEATSPTVVPLSYVPAGALEAAIAGKLSHLSKPATLHPVEESPKKRPSAAGSLARGASTLEEMARHLDDRSIVRESAHASGRSHSNWLPRWGGSRRTPADALHDLEGKAPRPLSSADGARCDEEPDWVFALRWGGKGAGALHAQLQQEQSEPRLTSDGTPCERAQHRRAALSSSGDASHLAASARRVVGVLPARGHRRSAST